MVSHPKSKPWHIPAHTAGAASNPLDYKFSALALSLSLHNTCQAPTGEASQRTKLKKPVFPTQGGSNAYICSYCIWCCATFNRPPATPPQVVQANYWATEWDGTSEVLSGSAPLYDIPNANLEALLNWQFPEHAAHICDNVAAWGLFFLGSISAEDMFNSLSGACNRIGSVLITLRGARGGCGARGYLAGEGLATQTV